MSDRVITEDQVPALQIVLRLEPWRAMLAGKVGTHGNATLEMADVLTVMLAAFYNPMVRSQRLLDALSSQSWMQQKTGVSRIARSTFSDALRRFDPKPLRALIQHMVKQIPALGRRDMDLHMVTQQVVAADGSYFNLMGEVAWALSNRRGNTDKPQSRVRLNLQLDVDTFTPLDADLSGKEDGSEPAAFIRNLRPGVIYVVDRNFLHFDFINQVFAADSHLVLRLRKNTAFAVAEDGERPLTARDQELEIIADQEGYLTGGKSGSRHLTAPPPKQRLRRVTVWDANKKCEVMLLTDLLDVPAYVVAMLYRKRWQIELFFKWLKCFAHFDHAWSHSECGLTVQFYIAIIATLLLYVTTGRKPDKYSLFWMSSLASGQATPQEAFAGLARIDREKQLKRERYARKKLAAQKGV